MTDTKAAKAVALNLVTDTDAYKAQVAAQKAKWSDYHATGVWASDQKAA